MSAPPADQDEQSASPPMLVGETPPPAAPAQAKARPKPRPARPSVVAFAEPRDSTAAAPAASSTPPGSFSSASLSSASSSASSPSPPGGVGGVHDADFFPKRREDAKGTVFCSPGAEDEDDKPAMNGGAAKDEGRAKAASRGPRVTLDSALEERMMTLVNVAGAEELLAISLDETSCTLSLAETAPFGGDSLRARFQRLSALVSPDAPRIFLLRLDFVSNSPDWVVISWTPAGVCSPARRTLVDYAAWSLRISLRFPRPVKEYYASEPEHLTLEAFRRAENQRRQMEARMALVARPFSSQEDARACRFFRVTRSPCFRNGRVSSSSYHEKNSPSPPVCALYFLSPMQAAARPRLPRSVSARRPPPHQAKAMPDVPMDVDGNFSEQVEEFRSGEVACLEVLIEDEDTTPVALPCIYETPELLQEHVTDGRPRYFLLRHQGITAFIFYCPEGESRRERVLYAACKQRVLNQFLQFGIPISQRYDVRSPAEISKILDRDGGDEGRGNSPYGGGSDSSADGGPQPGADAREKAEKISKENALVLLPMLPAKPPPPGDSWMQTDVLSKAEDSLEAWRRRAGLLIGRKAFDDSTDEDD
ncbi:hypothetical protein BESB_031350 [Besnoitia besnoiti]|uniref:ADF-H domain-containing protein n=1 Tax=Besnoitia besnoiti TaxID=94643 RepID=A0A2A9M4M6_BESBE|nr:hypothetical protein BESB_031350 [Besnoitia besnoiti]PFH31261.1 hypothetical protein BESB_031350 [Besnoitia besnoiti]